MGRKAGGAVEGLGAAWVGALDRLQVRGELSGGRGETRRMSGGAIRRDSITVILGFISREVWVLIAALMGGFLA